MANDDERGDGRRGGFSRRDFLRGSAAGALAPGLLGGGIALQGGAAAAMGVEAGKVVGPGPVPMSFKINGKTHEAELEPRVTLLDALREDFGLTGSKRVCDRGTCGACTVKLDGHLVYACSVLAIEAQNYRIETIEAVGAPEDLHPLQAAFVEADAQQCGFCTPGFVLAAGALLDEHPEPGAEEVDRGLRGNFCRCGTYGGIRRVMEGEVDRG